MTLNKELEEYSKREWYLISSAKSLFNDAIIVCSFLKQKLEKEDPQAKSEIQILEDALEMLEMREIDLESEEEEGKK